MSTTQRTDKPRPKPTMTQGELLQRQPPFDLQAEIGGVAVFSR